MAEQFTNKASTTLNGAINNSTTSVVVTSATGFPASGNFRIIIKAEGGNTDEIMTVTAVASTTFTVTRASEAVAGVQSASAHGSGATVSHVLTAGAVQNLHELSYVQITSTVSPTATVENDGDVVVTAATITFDGSTTVMIEFFSSEITPTNADNSWCRLLLFDDSTSLGYFGMVFNPKLASGSSIRVPVHLFRRVTPSAGSHTYSVRAYVNTGTASVAAGTGTAANNQPAFIRITRA